MESWILNLKSTLEKHLPIPIHGEQLENGVYQMQLENHLFHIYLYPHHVIDRLPALPNIKTIHVDQDTVEQNPNKIVDRLKVMAGLGRRVYARNTIVARIDKKTALDFQHEHHLLRPLPGKYRYGLYERGELVSIAVFSAGRRMLDKPQDYRSFELIRFCHKRDNITIGGVSKLIKAFCRDFSPGDIMTYVDRDWSQDSSLQKIGFQEKKTTPPQVFVVSAKGRLPVKYTVDSNLTSYPTYLKKNSGSIKMVLSLCNAEEIFYI